MRRRRRRKSVRIHKGKNCDCLFQVASPLLVAHHGRGKYSLFAIDRGKRVLRSFQPQHHPPGIATRLPQRKVVCAMALGRGRAVDWDLMFRRSGGQRKNTNKLERYLGRSVDLKREACVGHHLKISFP